jgi:hypothetical protein
LLSAFRRVVGCCDGSLRPHRKHLTMMSWI